MIDNILESDSDWELKEARSPKGVQVLKGSKEGSRQEAAEVKISAIRTRKEALMTMMKLNQLDSYNALQAKYDELQSEFGDQEAALVAHKSLAVKKLESQLKASPQNHLP
ncbi:hypothetical protein Tco_1079728 [Tanacetum coccineum]|uniref:No apical meristem-associated C-terminal domain-containing protein n=1 Tax=Tanacetum coccineum TaxID=301880 RepID=A0ABQ5HSU8_9ASTR